MFQRSIILVLILCFGKFLFGQETTIHNTIASKNIIVRQEGSVFRIENAIGDFKTVDSTKVLGNDAALIKKNGKWGMISEYGLLKIPIEFYKIKRLYNQFLLVEKNGLQGVYDSDGKKILPVEFEEVQFTSKAGAEFQFKKNGKYGLADDAGKIIFLPEYDEIKINISKNLISLKKGNFQRNFIGKSKVIVGIIDPEKSFCFSGEYISDSKCFYASRNGDFFQILDENGALLNDEKYDDINFKQIRNENITKNILLYKKNGKWGTNFFKESTILPPKYDSITILQPDLMVATENERSRLYQISTKKFSKFSFEKIIPIGFRDYPFRIEDGDKETLLDENFQLALPFLYEDVSVVKDKFIVKLNGKFGLVDKSGKATIPMIYKSLYRSCENYVAENSEGKFGVLSNLGKVLLPFNNTYMMGYSEYIEIRDETGKLKKLDCNLKCLENCN